MSFLYPGEYIDSTYSIDFDKLYKEGYRGIIFDIDNTLVTHGSPADERAIALFKHLKELGFSCLVLSNNKEPRVKSFAKQLGIKYIYKAGKPKPSGYRTAMERLGTDTKNTLFVGDQIFTDIIGANLTGIRSILVAPIDPHEEIQIVLKRFIEKPVIACYALLTRPPLSHKNRHSEEIQFKRFARLACVRHAASVHPEPGSNSRKI